MSVTDWRALGAEEILARLADVDLAAFEALSENAACDEDVVRVLLKDPGLAPDLVERISREPRFFQSNAVRVALVLHPRLPRVRGMELLRYLYWRDLLRASSQPSVHPQVRVVAGQLLAERVADLTLGERIALARAAGRAVVRLLRLDENPRVVDALLRNARCTEEDVVFMAGRSDAVPSVLAVIARSSRWRCRQPVRVQLVKNRRLGLPLALGLLGDLGAADLDAVARQADLPRVLREAAARQRADALRPARRASAGERPERGW